MLVYYLPNLHLYGLLTVIDALFPFLGSAHKLIDDASCRIYMQHFLVPQHWAAWCPLDRHTKHLTSFLRISFHSEISVTFLQDAE